ncbi:hypothetical protein GCM10010399_82610 [Dactylosporangium fulvum]|uniref:Carbohydrate binding domain-containing protein n=1 Tax=Dactylosporangium fulvum TaxID=53359 RepID=A0ABY5W716_9ACTN|nr:carbohydrate binding domain-containing protein [Dactylosporangium fulvum]UWP85868.1 carbohydrate binding domain-containing protein [Dactylosporangium fulvum]
MATGLAATAQQQYARVQLQLTFTTVTSATVSRVHADGTVWPVRAAAPALVASTTGVGWVGYDHEAPLDQPVTYRATSTQDPAVVASNPVTVASDPARVGSMIWLTHPLKPSLSRLITCTGIGARTRKARDSILPIIGRADPVAMTGARLSPVAEMTLLTTTLAETAGLAALLADGATLCVRCPGSWGQMWFYAAVGDAVDEGPAGVGPNQDREWRLPFTQVAAPAGVGNGAIGITYADVLATYGTYETLRTARSTPLNANPFFETDASSWTPTGGTFARSTAQAHQGAASGLLTPNGVSGSVLVLSESVPVVAGAQYRASAWVRSAATRGVDIAASWNDANGAFLSASTAAVTATAGTWTQIEVIAPPPAGASTAQLRVRMTGTPPPSNTLHIDEASFVELFTYSSIIT